MTDHFSAVGARPQNLTRDYSNEQMQFLFAFKLKYLGFQFRFIIPLNLALSNQGLPLKIIAAKKHLFILEIIACRSRAVNELSIFILFAFIRVLNFLALH